MMPREKQKMQTAKEVEGVAKEVNRKRCRGSRKRCEPQKMQSKTARMVAHREVLVLCSPFFKLKKRPNFEGVAKEKATR